MQALKYPSADAVTQWLYICQVSKQLIENKNDLLKLIKPKWPPQPCSQAHKKTDNTNRLAEPKNLYMYTPGYEEILNFFFFQISRQMPAIFIIGGKLKF